MKWRVKTLGKFLRRIAIDYVRFGYVWYSVREVPEEKNAEEVLERVCRYYSITTNRVTRLRQRREGKGSVVLVLYKRTLVILATEGVNRFFEEDHPYDIRNTPLYLFGYSIGVRERKPCVMIAPMRWRAIAKGGRGVALHDREKVTAYFENISPFQFPGIVRQRLELLNEINQRRKRAGLSRVKVSFGKEGSAHSGSFGEGLKVESRKGERVKGRKGN